MNYAGCMHICFILAGLEQNFLRMLTIFLLYRKFQLYSGQKQENLLGVI